MDNILSTGTVPAIVAIIIAVSGFILTQTRSAAKTTVDLLDIRYGSALKELGELRERITFLEQEKIIQLREYNEDRKRLQDQIEALIKQLSLSTALIRQDVKENTDISKAAFHEANGAKEAIKEEGAKTKLAQDRLDRLERGTDVTTS